jgi:3-dehydroshikimate dehydratase
MKLAFCINVFRNDELLSVPYRLAELGYHGVEIWQRQIEQNRWPLLRAAVADAGLRVAQLCPYFDLVNGPEKIEASVKLAETYVKLAVECPGEPALVRVFTGPLQGPGRVASAQCSQEVWAQAVAAMRRICQLGRPHGVRFALETHHGTLVDTSASIVQFIGDVAADNLGANLQVPLEGEPDPIESARKVGPHVIHLHANNHRDGKGTFLADGEYDFAAFVRAVRAAGPFDGYVSIEHAYHHPLWQTAVVEAGYLSALVAKSPVSR